MSETWPYLVLALCIPVAALFVLMAWDHLLRELKNRKTPR